VNHVKRRKKSLLYKVIEVSAVDEATLEAAVNGWVRKGWTFDGMHFAMRDSSKRPSMAFIFFTRMGFAADIEDEEPGPQAARSHSGISAYERLRQLAEGGDEP
jgi:hypothetical protein